MLLAPCAARKAPLPPYAKKAHRGSPTYYFHRCSSATTDTSINNRVPALRALGAAECMSRKTIPAGGHSSTEEGAMVPKLAQVGDIVTFRGEVKGDNLGLLSFEGPTVRIWRGDSRIIRVEPPGTELPNTIFRQLCEEYADAADGGGGLKRATERLLTFCHGYAYRINGVEPW